MDVIKLTEGQIEVHITPIGASITRILTPDRHGNIDDIVLGYDDLNRYHDNPHYFGTTTGRVANRISCAQFKDENQTVCLSKNHGDHHLHGGHRGLSHRVFTIKEHDLNSVLLEYFSPHGEEGYPGNVEFTVEYRLRDGALDIHWKASTDRKTPINLTQHTYFNLDSGGSSSVKDHLLQIEASYFLPTNLDSIPTGELVSLKDSPFDFRKETPIRNCCDSSHTQVKKSKGMDHFFVLDKSGKEFSKACTLKGAESGRRLEVWTTQPGVQVYTANGLDEKFGLNNRSYQNYSALCLETQHHPDALNQREFPSIFVDSAYEEHVRYLFSCD